MTSLRQMVKRVLPQSVLDWLRQFKANRTAGDGPRLPERGPKVEEMIGLESALWSTNDPTDVERLDRAISRTGANSRSRAYGSLAVARWEYHEGRPDTALQRLEGAHTADQELQAELDLFRADCLFALGDPQSALILLSRMTGRFTTDHNLLLRVGQARALMGQATDHGSGPASEALNRIYHGAGLGMIRRTSVGDPVAIDNLSCEVRVAEPVSSLPLVSVVVLMPDSLPEKHCGLDCLLDQSWKNLEIVVVGGTGAGRRLTAADRTLLGDRVRVVEDGSTTAPSVFKHVTGELVTAHRYGSWAHPQRIELQASAMMFDPSLRGVVGHHLNVSSELNPIPLAFAPRTDLVGPDPVSMMVRIAAGEVEAAGATYHEVVSAHSPVTGRLGTVPGVAEVKEGVPLTLTLADTSSRSAAGAVR